MTTADPLENLPKRLVVRFAADCAEHVLPIFERAYPDDPRPREAIAAVRDWLEGRTSRDQLERVRLAAGKASAKPLGNHAVTGNPGWMTGLLANEAESAAEAAADAASAALTANDAGEPAAAASRAAAAAVMAAVLAWADKSGMDFAAATAYASPIERAWQAERLASLSADLSPNTLSQ
jgi:hypothetical protein